MHTVRPSSHAQTDTKKFMSIRSQVYLTTPCASIFFMDSFIKRYANLLCVHVCGVECVVGCASS